MTTKTKKKIVLIRTYSAGVHFGELVSRKGQEVVLRNARRIWSWQGANSLNEIASAGCEFGSKISDKTEEQVLPQMIEMHNMSEAAIKRMAELGWGK